MYHSPFHSSFAIILRSSLLTLSLPSATLLLVRILLSSKVSPANLLEGFGVSAVIVPQLSIMHIVYFNEI